MVGFCNKLGGLDLFGFIWIYLFAFVCLFICLFIYLFVYLFICLFVVINTSLIGFLVILRGYNHSTSDTSLEGGVVTMLRDSKVCGLCRMIQGSVVCVVEGSLSGLEEGEHRVQIHSGGDITRGANSCGGVYGELEYKYLW